MKQAMRHAPRPLRTAVGSTLPNLRRICAGWDAVDESLSLGLPAFRVRGTPFAVPDRYRDSDCLRLDVPPAELAALFSTPGWSAAPKYPRPAALCVRLEAIDSRRIGPHVRISCALAAAPRARTSRGAGR